MGLIEDDPLYRAIILDRLRGKLAAFDYDRLGLDHLEPLRQEIRQKLEAIYAAKGKKKGET